MAKSRSEKMISRMVEKVQNHRQPMSAGIKVLYWGCMLGLFISVLVLPGILKMLTGSTLMFLVPMVLFSAGIITIIYYRKKKSEKVFWQTRDIDGKVIYTKFEDASKIEQFCDGNTWIFGSKKEDLMPFIYNWFLTLGVIEDGDKVNVYYFPVSLIKSRFKYKDSVKRQLEDSHELFLISLNELDIDEATDKELSKESSIIRPYDFFMWLTSNFAVAGLLVHDDDEEDEDYDEDEEDELDEMDEDEEDIEEDESEDEE